jgi:uncharacterized membrane protein YgcG
MNRLRRTFRIAPWLLLLALAAPLPLEAQENGRSLRFREIAVRAYLDAEGRLHVRERQAMVFDGDWNGGERSFDLRHGQQLRLHEVVRIDPESGARTALTRGELDAVDRFDWAQENTLRWRSRSASAPPFADEELQYELAYTLWPVLVRSAEGETEGDYLLRHDFAFPGRMGPIEQFAVDLTLHRMWQAASESALSGNATQLPPNEGYGLTPTLRYTGEGVPAAVPTDTEWWGRAAGLAAAVLVPFLVFLGLLGRGRELDRVARITPRSEIDEAWLGLHIFSHPPEVIGASWDRSVGQPEVAALLARMVKEGRLTSRVETEGKEPVLHLRRVEPLSSFADHERALLEALFYDGTDSTDTKSVREHYKQEGFDPASIIRKALTAQLAALPGEGRMRRRWLLPAAVTIAGITVAVGLPAAPGSVPVIVLGLVVAGALALIALPLSSYLARRVTHRTGLTVAVLLPFLLAGVLLALLAAGAFEGDSGLVFYRPPASLVAGLAMVFAGLGMLAVALAKPTETVERLAFRRRLVSAREFFEAELERPEPRLQDPWFPYLLAFGLGPHVDRWFESFGAEGSDRHVAPIAVATGAGLGGSGGGWSGGGVQFGGGTFGGGGAGGTWSVAAAGMAAGVSAPSSSNGGGGGVTVSGGGGGGGW